MEEVQTTRGDDIKKYVVLFFAEFFGTAMMMYIGCLGTILPRYAGMQPIIVSVTFGASIMAAVLAFRHVSGPHLNPCVSLGILILGRIDWKKMLVYFAGQYTGSFFGYTILWFSMPPSSVHLKPCALTIHPFMTSVKVFFLEMGASFVLFIVISGVVDVKNEPWGDSIGLKFGITIFGLVVAFAEITGAGLNSARALPSALFNNVWDGHWAFHFGPFIGMVLAAALYRLVFETHAKYSLNDRDEI